MAPLMAITMQRYSQSNGHGNYRDRNRCLCRGPIRAAVGEPRRTIHVELFDCFTMKDKLLHIGIGGSVVAALCCFTPLLVVLLGAVGLSAVVGYLDIVLFPTLAIFLGITGYAIWKRSQTASN